MNKRSKEWYDQALRAINGCFNDPSIPLKDVKPGLESLRDEIEIMIESLGEGTDGQAT